MRLAAFAALLIAAAAAPATLAQQEQPAAETIISPTGLLCSSLAGLDETQRLIVVYYVAGYTNAERDLQTIGVMGGGQVPLTGPTDTTPAQEPAVAQQQPQVTQQPQADQEAPGQAEMSPPSHMASASAVVPSLAIDGILTACGQSPNSRIADMITAHGGMGPG